MHWLQGYSAALLRQRLGEAVPAILLPAPPPSARLALGLDTAAPLTPAQVAHAPGASMSPLKPTPQPERKADLLAFDGDTASYASDAASEADSDDFAEWAHDFALAPPADVSAAIDKTAPAPAADPAPEGPPAQEPAPPAPCDDRLGAACARFIAAPAVFLISAAEACVPGAAPVRGSPSSPACVLCLHSRPRPSRSGFTILAVDLSLLSFLPCLLGACAGDRLRHHECRRGRGWRVDAARSLALSARGARRPRRRLRAHLSRTGRAAGAPGFGGGPGAAGWRMAAAHLFACLGWH